MRTPFDSVIEHIEKAGYHGHRGQAHSNLVSHGIFVDLVQRCDAFRRDVERGVIKSWTNIRTPGGRGRLIDLFVGEPDEHGEPDLRKLRLGIENKSIITAHRNKGNRFDELAEALEAIQRVRPEAIMVATILVGTAGRVLNIPDVVKRYFDDDDAVFQSTIVPRLSRGDQNLWEEYGKAISENAPDDPKKTVEYFRRKLAARNPALTNQPGYDFVMIAPIAIDNVNPPMLPRPNHVDVDIDEEYDRLLSVVCRAYASRWHF